MHHTTRSDRANRRGRARRHGHGRPAITAIALSGSAAVALHEPAVLLVLAGTLVLLYLGVVLPAVWFKAPDRRRDARTVLQQLLDLSHWPGNP